MSTWIDATGKAFERLLRWIFPGLLFLVLLYLFMEPTFIRLSFVRGYPWPLIIGALGVGAVVYLIQVNVINQLYSSIAQAVGWLVQRKSDKQQSERPKPRACLKKIVCCWDKQADDIEASHVEERLNSYMAYLNASYHATSITGWLTLIFYLLREPRSLLYAADVWVAVFIVFMFIASLNLFARLSRVRY